MDSSDIQCRACMCKKIRFQLFHSLKDIQLNMTIHRLFMHLMPQLVIQENDEFPQFVCAGCVTKLRNAYLFQEMCMESDQKYREALFKRMNSVPAETIAKLTSDATSPRPEVNTIVENNQTTVMFQLPKNTIIVPISKQATIIASKKISLDDENSDSLPEIFEENNFKVNKTYDCPICKKTYSTSTHLKNHQNSHLSESPFECGKCKKNFSSKHALGEHMLRHSRKLNFKCPHCPRRFPCRSDIYKHLLTHTLRKNHICEICGSGFKRNYSLTRHMRRMHSNQVQRTFKCEICSATCKTQHKLKLHTRIHTGERPHPCQYCSRAFKQGGDLLKHLRLHLGDKIYDCTICKKRFKYQAELREHQTECPPEKKTPQNINLDSVDIKDELHDTAEPNE